MQDNVVLSEQWRRLTVNHEPLVLGELRETDTKGMQVIKGGVKPGNTRKKEKVKEKRNKQTKKERIVIVVQMDGLTDAYQLARGWHHVEGKIF